MWIGCSDSRVIPELITGADPGELFVVRNIANVAPPAGAADCGSGAAVEYAVIHLGVDHIVVCGHTECGGIAALAGEPAPESEPNIVAWLDYARPARDRVLGSGIADEKVSIETIRTNVLIQLDNLRTHDCVRDREAAGTLRLHGWLYDVHAGTIQAWDPATQAWRDIASRPSPAG